MESGGTLIYRTGHAAHNRKEENTHTHMHTHVTHTHTQAHTGSCDHGHRDWSNASINQITGSTRQHPPVVPPEREWSPRFPTPSLTDSPVPWQLRPSVVSVVSVDTILEGSQPRNLGVLLMSSPPDPTPSLSKSCCWSLLTCSTQATRLGLHRQPPPWTSLWPPVLPLLQSFSRRL